MNDGRYYVAPYSRGYAVYDISTDQPVTRIYATRADAERAAARRNPRPATPTLPYTEDPA